MKPYPAYKDSGVEWIGQVPEEWDIKRLKYCLTLITDKNTCDLFNKVALENIEGWTGNYLKTTSDFSGDGFAFKSDDILLGKLRPYLAKVWQAKFNGNAVGDIFVYRVNEKIAPRFAFYRFISRDFIDVLNGSTFGAKMPRVSSEFIDNLNFAYPPYAEQTSIATYLDCKTAQIDTLIEQKHRLIELLREERIAVISHAVTRGLNPTARMKDSGVEWIGQVPEHWEVKRLKFAAVINPSKSELAELPETFEVSFYPMEAIGSGSLNGGQHKTLKTLGSGFTYFRDGDILVAKITPSFENGKGAVASGLTNGIGFGTTEIHVIRPQKNLNIYFLYYLTYSHPFRKVGEGMMEGTAGQKRVPNDFLLDYPLALPPIEEQTAIATYLDETIAQIDQTIARTERQIELLQEYRTTLISAVVTGKIDVREEVTL